MNQCINCQAETAGKFCANCGQRTSVKRITFREGWNDFWARIYGFDGMFPNTLRDLTIRPGKASLLFINGNRTKYYGPVGYFFLMITLLYLVSSLLDVPITEFMKSTSKAANLEPPKAGSGHEKFNEAILQFVSDNLKFVTFLFIPAQAFISRYLFFRKSNLSYIEHTILPFYTQGHVYWVSVFSLIFYKVSGAFFSGVATMVLTIVYVGYAYSNLFDYQSKLKAFFKGIGVWLFSYFLLMIIFIVGMIISLIINPDLFEMLRPSNNR